jgi:autotransporter passenger strand-loop-strand repeat protein
VAVGSASPEANLSGGTASNTVDSSVQIVSSGGVAIGTTLSGGNQYVSSGGTAINTTGSGYQEIYSGGTASGASMSGSVQDVYGY